ncbi:MAG: acetoacetate decarboxylase [Asgard group archaeon]|nr:acetoacetate decarboxylase [Asgard group archaeon]
MSFKLNDKHLFESLESADLLDVSRLDIFWETKPEIIERLLPPPLKPGDRPIAFAYTANFGGTNFGIATYKESAVFISCKYNGEDGMYCLSMPVNHDIAMALGREMFGYPKKMATIHLEKSKGKAIGWTERHGIRINEMKASFLREISEEKSIELGLGKFAGTNITYLFKHFPFPSSKSSSLEFDYKPRLVKSPTESITTKMFVGKGSIKFQPSNDDPWHELKVEKMLGAAYKLCTVKMLPAEFIAEVEPDEFMPYAYLKWD